MNAALNILRNEKISGGLIILIVAGLWWMHAWASEEFVSKQEYQTLTEKVDMGFEEMRINSATQTIRDLELSRSLAQHNEASADELIRMDEEIALAKRYKDCLIRRDENCQYLKES